MAMPLPRPPVLLDPAVEDPALVHRLIDQHAPYWPVQRYFATSAEYATLSGERGADMVVGPVFRGSWAVEGRAEEGVEPLLGSARFEAAARELFQAEVVRPTTVYVNLTWQLPFPQGAGHTDVPAFRGFDRSTYPITILTIMGQSGLFEDVRVNIATAVAWFYERSDGGFEYWPDGPLKPSQVHEGDIDNTAIVGDNDFMWHRVRPTGAADRGMATLSLDSELRNGGGGRWSITDGAGGEVAAFPRDELRVSLSWKAEVFATEEQRRRHDEHTDDIDLAEVVRRFQADLSARGIDATIPADPVRDPDFIALLRDVYVTYPTAA